MISLLNNNFYLAFTVMLIKTLKNAFCIKMFRHWAAVLSTLCNAILLDTIKVKLFVIPHSTLHNILIKCKLYKSGL